MTYINTTLNRHNFSTKLILAVFAVALLLPVLMLFAPKAHAASLTNSFIRLDRLATSTSNDNTLVVFKVPAGNAVTEDNVQVTFPSSTYITVGATPTVTVTGCTTDANNSGASSTVALPGTLTAAGSGQVVTVSGVTNLSASTYYCFYLSSGISTTSTAIPTTPASAGEATITTRTSTTNDDTTNVGMTTIANDQVVVTAAVAPYIQFTLSGNTDNLGTLDQTAVTSSGTPKTVTLKTNAANGWITWAKDLNAGLTSASASQTIPSSGTVDGTPQSITAGTAGYGLAVGITTDSATAGTGTVTVNGEYNADSSHYGTLSNTAYNPIATSNGPTDGDVISLTFRATIGALTKAATDYTDTLFVTGAGNF